MKQNTRPNQTHPALPDHVPSARHVSLATRDGFNEHPILSLLQTCLTLSAPSPLTNVHTNAWLHAIPQFLIAYPSLSPTTTSNKTAARVRLSQRRPPRSATSPDGTRAGRHVGRHKSQAPTHTCTPVVACLHQRRPQVLPTGLEDRPLVTINDSRPQRPTERGRTLDEGRSAHRHLQEPNQSLRCRVSALYDHHMLQVND